MKKVIHYEYMSKFVGLRAACRIRFTNPVVLASRSQKPEEVTCLQCRCTRKFRDAMKDAP